MSQDSTHEQHGLQELTPEEEQERLNEQLSDSGGPEREQAAQRQESSGE